MRCGIYTPHRVYNGCKIVKRGMNQVKKFYERFCQIENILAVTCLVAMMLIVFASAVLRACGHPLNWATDIALFLTAWGTFLGADVAFRGGKLVRVDMLTNAFPEKFQKWLAAAMYVLILGFLCMLIFYGIDLSITTKMRTFQGIPGFSYTWVTIAVPISALFMSITAVRHIVANVRRALGKNADESIQEESILSLAQKEGSE